MIITSLLITEYLLIAVSFGNYDLQICCRPFSRWQILKKCHNILESRRQQFFGKFFNNCNEKKQHKLGVAAFI
jgi:hypothetical protein